MSEELKPKYTDGQRVSWNLRGKAVECHVETWFRVKWPNGSGGRMRMGYEIKEHPGTWAWEEELSEVGEETQ